MMRMKLTILLFLLCISTFAAKKPNIIFIFADDIGYEAVNCYGGLDFKTPSLNRMADEGLLFSNMYTSPVCTPSRVSMHTGLYTFRHKHIGVLPVHTGTKKKVNFEKMPTYAQQLRKNGYATSVTGKWQLATLEEWPNHVKDAGFDSWCVWQIWHNNKKTDRHWNATYNQDGKVRTDIADKFGPDVLTDYVIDQMTAATKANKPFFILHNELLPHWPVIDTPDDRKLKRKPALSGMINYMDKLVGRVLDKVDELGIRDNTYVIFMGDNGTWEKDFNNPKFGDKNEGKHTRHTIHGKVNGGKAKLCDAGSHVPFLVWGPPSVPKNAVNKELVDVVDLFPTFCELTGSDIPESIKTDGRSIAKQVHGQTGPKREWTHQGLGNDQNIFDGEWRYFIKKKILWDARKLPIETKVSPDSSEAQAAIKKSREIYKKISSSQPSPPDSVSAKLQ
ncbi:MAG: sulfatase-like hydrolase/transferase [Lentisphaeraceae bacterium]|nr:sulfatase-like hydrolase/transferase [Lentisphaeraceae bacterium]